LNKSDRNSLSSIFDVNFLLDDLIDDNFVVFISQFLYFTFNNKTLLEFCGNNI